MHFIVFFIALKAKEEFFRKIKARFFSSHTSSHTSYSTMFSGIPEVGK